MKKIILMMIIGFLTSLSAYSYASAGKEPTIDAKEKILKAINVDDYKSAMDIFKSYEKNYKYLSDDFINKLHNGLKKSIQSKDKNGTMYYLELSLAAEVQRRVDGGYENINTYNVAKVMLAKANKFYKLLSVSLKPELNKKLKSALRSCTKAIGNPGLFGVGSKIANKDMYELNQKIIIEIIQDL